jgi:hypothetical protein
VWPGEPARPAAGSDVPRRMKHSGIRAVSKLAAPGERG